MLVWSMFQIKKEEKTQKTKKEQILVFGVATGREYGPTASAYTIPMSHKITRGPTGPNWQKKLTAA